MFFLGEVELVSRSVRCFFLMAVGSMGGPHAQHGTARHGTGSASHVQCEAEEGEAGEQEGEPGERRPPPAGWGGVGRSREGWMDKWMKKRWISSIAVNTTHTNTRQHTGCADSPLADPSYDLPLPSSFCPSPPSCLRKPNSLKSPSSRARSAPSRSASRAAAVVVAMPGLLAWVWWVGILDQSIRFGFNSI